MLVTTMWCDSWRFWSMAIDEYDTSLDRDLHSVQIYILLYSNGLYYIFLLRLVGFMGQSLRIS
jgi:hypothetical protein